MNIFFSQLKLSHPFLDRLYSHTPESLDLNSVHFDFFNGKVSGCNFKMKIADKPDVDIKKYGIWQRDYDGILINISIGNILSFSMQSDNTKLGEVFIDSSFSFEQTKYHHIRIKNKGMCYVIECEVISVNHVSASRIEGSK